MKHAIQFLAFFILPFVLFGQYTDATTAGFIKVKSGISAPSTVVRGSSFTVSFKLKETLGQSITVQELALALHKENGAYIEDLKKWTTSSYCSFGANEEKNFNFSANITSASVIEGEYKLVLKLKINNAWLDIQVLSSTAMNPKSVYVDVLAPTIVTSVSNLNFGSVEVGSSKTMTYSVSAQNLTADLKLTAPTGFQLQADGSLWNPTLTIPPSSDGSINNVTIRVRFSPTQAGPYNGLITHKSTGANTKNVNLSADGIEIPSYNIQTSANPSSGGNPSGAGTYLRGSVCHLNSNTNPGWIFNGWYNLSGNLESSNSTYTFTVTDNRYLIAKFTLQPPPSYTVSVVSSPTEGGSVTGGGSFVLGSTCSVTASSATGYDFVGWYDVSTGNLESSNPSYSFIVYGNKYLSAHFSLQPPPSYTVSVVSSPTEGGSVTGGGSFVLGSTCSVTATSATGYDFVGWYDVSTGNLESSNPSYSFIVYGNQQLVAKFEVEALPQYLIYLSKTGDGDGIVLLNGSMIPVLPCTLSVTATETVTFFALPDASSLFTGWEGDLTGTTNPTSFTIASNMTIIVGFASTVPVELISYSVTAVSNDVNIQWATATETNASHFIIERKLSDGEWFETGNVRAAGTSTTTKNYDFVDKNVAAGKYFYRLKQVDFDGRFQIFDAFDIEVVTPVTIKLDQNYPNPFNPSTRIDFSIPVSANVTLDIFDISGQKVATVISGQMSAGYHFVNVDAAKYGMSSGTYVYRLSADKFTVIKKMILVK